jgi:hypothetical protein
MRLQRVALATTVLNLVLLLGLVSQLRSVAAQDAAPVLRGRALEIVDAQGRVRASLGILPPPADRTSAGQADPETVILRLIDVHGRPAVKIATSDEGSGLSLTGRFDTHETYVSMASSGTSSQLKLRNENGREQLFKP